MRRERHSRTDEAQRLKWDAGDRIREALQGSGVSVSMAARLVGVSTTSVYRWEEGTAQPNIQNLQALCNLAGVSPSWVIHGTEMPLFEALALAKRQGRQYCHPIFKPEGR